MTTIAADNLKHWPTLIPKVLSGSLLMALGLASKLPAQQPSGPDATTSTLPAWALGPFARPADANPAIAPNPASSFQSPQSATPVHWEGLHTFNPAAVVRDGKICVVYQAEDDSGNMAIGGHTSRLGLAESDDGLHFKRFPAPVFYPDIDSRKDNEWPGGCEDPRIVESADGTYVLTYTQWNRKILRIGIATSPDLVHWTKYGPIFAGASGGKYDQMRYKSSGIVTEVEHGRLIAAKINGRDVLGRGRSSSGHFGGPHPLATLGG